MDAQAQQLLDFWLDEVGEEGWYRQDEALDATIRERWMGAWEVARDGGLRSWVIHPGSCLALVILLDQFPRNMFRGDARSFVSDRVARITANAAIQRGIDKRVELPARQFFYLPMMHSELPVHQDRSVRLFLINFGREDEHLRHARAHRDIIRRFGRFPYRNAALGRASTPEEEAFLAEGGYMAALEAVA